MLSTRRAIQEIAPVEHWGYLLRYRGVIKGTFSGDAALEAMLWLTGTDEGQRLHRFIKWAGTARVNRRVRADPSRRALYSDFYRVVRRMRTRLRDDAAFGVDCRDAEILLLKMRQALLVPVVKEALERERVEEDAARRRQADLNGVYLRHQDSIEKAVTAVRRRSGGVVPRDALASALGSAPELVQLKNELRPFWPTRDEVWEPTRAIRLFPDLFPPTRGPRSGQSSRKK